MPTSRVCGRPFELICPTLLAQCTGVFLQTGPKPWKKDSAPTEGMCTPYSDINKMTLDTKLNTICTYVRILLNKSTNVHLDLCRAVPIICFFPGCHWMADDDVPEQATAALRMHIGESTLQLWLVKEATENMYAVQLDSMQ